MDLKQVREDAEARHPTGSGTVLELLDRIEKLERENKELNLGLLVLRYGLTLIALPAICGLTIMLMRATGN